MKKNFKRKNLILICCVILLILFVLFILISYNMVNSSKKREYHLSDGKKFDLCIDDCSQASVPRYMKLTIDYGVDILEKKVDSINKKTEELYQEMLNSKVTGEECSSAKGKYNYRYVYSDSYENYSDDRYISIAIDRKKADTCLDTETSIMTEAYVYDKKNKKIVSSNDLVKSFDLTDNDILDACNTALKYYYEFEALNNVNSEMGGTFNSIDEIGNYVVYYSTVGDLCISFKVPDSDIVLSGTLIASKTKK